MSENIDAYALFCRAWARRKALPVTALPLRSKLSAIKRSTLAAATRCVESVRGYWSACRPEDLTKAIRRFGIGPGTCLIVDSAFDGMRHFQGTPREAVEALIRAVEPGGTLVMPAFSFAGRSYDHLLGNPTFDVRTTPAQTGLLCETLRRYPGTRRSLHPTHSVVAWGRRAEEVTADHHNSKTPFDEHSPWKYLFEMDTWDLTLAVRLGAGITHHHYFEELLEPVLGVRLYWPEPFEVAVRDADGNIRRMKTYAHDPSSKGTRDYDRLNRYLLRTGTLRHKRVGSMHLWAGPIRPLFEATRDLAHRGISAFDAPPVPGRGAGQLAAISRWFRPRSRRAEYGVT